MAPKAVAPTSVGICFLFCTFSLPQLSSLQTAMMKCRSMCTHHSFCSCLMMARVMFCVVCSFYPFTVRMKVPLHASPTVLLWFRVLVMLKFLSCAQAFLALTLLLFALNLPCRLAADSDALSGTANSDFLLLLLHLLRPHVVG
jgi:hypothetical protein